MGTLVENKTPPRWETGLFIDGTFVEGSGAVLEVPSPVDGKLLASLATASSDDLDAAIRAAQAAQNGAWGSMAPRERSRLLHRFADRIEEMHDELTAAMVTEVGSPITLASTMQTALPVQVLRVYADLAAVDRTEHLGLHDEPYASASMVNYLPCGIVAVITAYNYPLLLALRTMGGALAAGCSTIVLPSPRTPLSTLLVMKAAQDAGIPEGALNVVVGGPEVGKRLCADPAIEKVAFTGSLEVGKLIMAQAAAGVKGVTLELGGKSPTVLLPGFDATEMVFELHARYLRNAGQGCAAATRILVPAAYHDEFVQLSVDAYGDVKTGDPWDPETLVGPLIRDDHRARVERYVDGALAQGATLLAGGGRPEVDGGWYMNPALLGSVDNSSEIAQAELFGPVGVIIPYTDVDDAVRIANDSEFGLAANVFSPDAKSGIDVAGRLRVGSVYVNGGGGFRPDAPFGGFKASGIGREYGEWGIREFLEPQHVQWRL